MSRKLSSFDESNICKCYLAGESTKNISDFFGRHIVFVRQILNRNGISTKVILPDLPIDEIKKRYLSGESENSIAKSFKVSRTKMRKTFIENNIKTRDNATANRIMMATRTTEENRRNSANAHAAVRGVPQTKEHRHKIAKTREAHPFMVAPSEIILADELRKRNIAVIPQKAIGSYNVDVAITESRIAVEIFGGCWHSFGSHARRFRKRTDYILNHGYAVVIIWVNRDYPLSKGAIEYLVTLNNKISTEKTLRSQEHVLRGDGNPSGIGQTNLKYGAIVGGDKCGPLVRGKDGRFSH